MIRRLATFIAGHSVSFILGCTYSAVLIAGGQSMIALLKALAP